MPIFIFCLIGCGGKETQDKIIVLKEPVNASVGYELADYRDLYDITVFPTVVSPYVEEYSFAKDQIFGSYEHIPGEYVNKGDVLVSAVTRESQDALENIDEQIDDLIASQTVESQHMKSDLDATYGAERKYGGGEGYVKQRARMEERISESNALFLLEKEHLEAKRSLVEKESQSANITSGLSGEIVNCAFVYGAEEIQKDVPLIAVGDTNKKLIKCEYINPMTIASADDFYAFFDGKRYNLVDCSMDGKEAAIQKKNGETVYSTFAIEDPESEVSFGQYGVIVLVKKQMKNVLCVPRSSVKTENGISYVYLTDGESSTYTEVETGLSDSFYTEILSGVSKSDKVITNDAPRMGKNTAVLERGECSEKSDIYGILYYPFSKWIVNPADEGRAYIKEICVEEYQQVKPGDVIVKIEVIQDSVEIDRVNNRIARLNQRIQDELKRQSEFDEKNEYITDPLRKLSDRDIEKNIVSYQKELMDAERTLKKLKKYSGIIDIKADAEGIITDIGTLKEGDVIYPDTKILQFADVSKSYIVLKDEKAELSYGQEVDIDYAAIDGSRTEIKGKVVTVSNTSLSSDMAKQWSLISVNDEYRDSMFGSNETSAGLWSRNTYKVSINSKQMNNVILVPKASVQMKGRDTYVKVVNSDGSVSLKGFLSGGSNNSYYWAISGLSEGTKICWD